VIGVTFGTLPDSIVTIQERILASRHFKKRPQYAEHWMYFQCVKPANKDCIIQMLCFLFLAEFVKLLFIKLNVLINFYAIYPIDTV